MLDDGRGRLIERVCEAHRGVEVEQVVVRELLPLELLEWFRVPRNVEGRGLLRVFAVAEVLELGQLEREIAAFAEEVRNPLVVLARFAKYLDRAAAAEVIADLARFELAQEIGVQRRIAER